MNEFNADNHSGDVEIGQMHTNKVGLEEEEQEYNEFIGQGLENMDAMKDQRYTGAHKVICENNKGEIILTLGPHWFVFLIGICALLFMGCGTLRGYWDLISNFKKVMMIGIMILEVLLYVITALLNPGIKTRRVPPFGQSRLTCKKCFTTKEDRVVHCEDCDVCIQGHDHHCVWTGKCIGRGNYVPFILFVVCTPCYLVCMFMIVGDKY